MVIRRTLAGLTNGMDGDCGLEERNMHRVWMVEQGWPGWGCMKMGCAARAWHLHHVSGPGWALAGAGAAVVATA